MEKDGDGDRGRGRWMEMEMERVRVGSAGFVCLFLSLLDGWW